MVKSRPGEDLIVSNGQLLIYIDTHTNKYT